VNDALLVRRLQRGSNLPCDCQGLVERNRAACDAIGKGLAVDELERQRACRRAPRSRRFRRCWDG
jgi:hypothetical protein